MTDTLLELLEAQWEIEKKFRPVEAENGFWESVDDPERHFPVDIRWPDNQSFIKDAMFRMIEELMEASNLLKNRPWKKTLLDVDTEAFREEIADYLHFHLRLMLILFGPPEKAAAVIRRIYFAKAEINHQRHEQGV